jgi:hypothetical protein
MTFSLPRKFVLFLCAALHRPASSNSVFPARSLSQHAFRVRSREKRLKFQDFSRVPAASQKVWRAYIQLHL